MDKVSDGLGFLIKGGPVMWPLFVCAILSIAVIIERFIVVVKAGSGTNDFFTDIKRLVQFRNYGAAIKLAEDNGSPIARMVAVGINNRHLDSEALDRLLEESALGATPHLYRRLGILDTIITIAPLLGLLGTVTGMIQSFHVVGTAGLNDSFGITGGVAEALIATATGLAIAIVTLVGYNYLSEKVKELIADMEIRATQISNILCKLRDEEGQNNETKSLAA
jgi:biopolymer transport protein ExbB